MMNQSVFLLLGTNMGDRRKNLSDGLWAIEARAGSIRKRSHIYETAPWGKTDQSAFYNQAIQIATFLKPKDLLEQLHAIESTMGRLRNEKWGERIIDIDILLYGSDIIESETLTIPHPQLPYRKFALAPLAELADDFIHPKMFQTIHELLKNCEDQLEVKKIRS
ncbi:MAG: 2-amino-4-hydroxy-6-hydroxymethyldihydropteridine diphosphokinase [Chryseolinea sp.]